MRSVLRSAATAARASVEEPKVPAPGGGWHFRKELLLRGASLDRRLLGRADLDPLRLRLLGLGYVHFEEAVHETAHLVLQRGDLAERLPANQRCHLIPPFATLMLTPG